MTICTLTQLMDELFMAKENHNIVKYKQTLVLQFGLNYQDSDFELRIHERSRGRHHGPWNP